MADRTDEVSSKHCFEVADRLTWFEEIFEEKATVYYDQVKLTWFEEIFESINH
ncbi:hypothetical protein [Streptococcus pneumoniae]|uniref:hypothetical protein n=1 Tax=Streptococcus pneumoniae TaxID=1313 RepID=UPI000B596D51|nr:hypothetical protein [Streptococcus pneumoniae]